MNTPVIVSAVRTAIGKKGGALKDIHPAVYGGMVIKEAINRANINSSEIDDVIMGNCLSNAGNVARYAALEAGLDVTVPGLTIDRQCGSGINSIILAAQAISANGGTYIAGGTESMTLEPYLLGRSPRPYDQAPPAFLKRQLSPDSIGDPPMGITAENLAKKYSISFEEQNEFALDSQKKMDKAIQSGKFRSQILDITIKDRKGIESVFNTDEHPRGDITLEQLSRLRPVFKENGTVTAGTSSGINDGAAATVMMSYEDAKSKGLKPLAKVIAYAVSGVDPNIMGIGPVTSTQQALKNANLTLDDIDLIEINEAFASQVIACHRELNFDLDKVNVNGGAIAHGHPIAATGTILTTKLIYELKDRNKKLGLVTACIGGGQGISLIIENLL